MTKYYELYNFFSNKVGEDISMKILRMTGVVQIFFSIHHFSFSKYTYMFEDRITNIFIKIDNYNKNIITQNTLRNYIFRHDIKVYYLHEIITDSKSKKNFIPIGKFFEQRPVIPFKKCKILLCDIQVYNNHLYILIDYVNQIPKDGIKIISKLRM